MIKYKIGDKLFLLCNDPVVLTSITIEAIILFDKEPYYYVSGVEADTKMAYRQDMFYINQEDAIINMSK